MKSNMQKDTKEKYEKVKRLVKRAEKVAEKFIKANKSIDPQLRIKYS